MPNWTTTRYCIESDPETIGSLVQALVRQENPEILADDTWEVEILKKLGVSEDILADKYLRGYFTSCERDKEDRLFLVADEAWGLTEFAETLHEAFPNTSIHYWLEEPGVGVYITNDIDGEYFPERFKVDIEFADGEWDCAYFNCEEDLLEDLSEILGEEVSSLEDALHKSIDKELNDGVKDFYVNEFEIDCDRCWLGYDQNRSEKNDIEVKENPHISRQKSQKM